MQIDVEYIKGEVQRMRSLQPEICWRPAPDWVNACLLDLGHEGPCGWERKSALIDGSQEPST